MSTCPQRWLHDGEPHQCKHDAGHEKRRHVCECGSWPGDRGATPLPLISPDASRAERPAGVDGRREVAAPHVASRYARI